MLIYSVNQQDQDKRISQVKLMRNVYSEAEVVFSWLRSGLDDIDLAFEFFSIIRIETATTNGEETNIEWIKDYGYLYVEDAEENPFNKHWNAVDRFFGIPYWNRIWIFPELVPGKYIPLQHGPAALLYNDLERSNSWFEQLRTSICHDQTQRLPFIGRGIWNWLSAAFLGLR
jgi:hypothetical protein